ncbi:facilitated trehalose transporter Tret1-2 homolog isoform X1 [Diabrotica virgifera virgifera]|uniref:Major facilitator superfamily (MFS) profile domain-containing protein n=1 Tax=Diabrotica virgifera virgifera TaxID=50390 RepID=A0ABM5ISU2_DIAVI|nr:facilitated trehalose transporter Tret1-2 homolog isoform X1 [Diabrotica virgifera virgifera]
MLNAVKQSTLLEQIKIHDDRKRGIFSLPRVLYCSVLTADLLLVGSGIILVWPSAVLPKLRSNDTEVNPIGRPITPVENSTIMASSAVSALLSFFLMAKLSDAIGRKMSMRVLAIVDTCILTVLAFATNIYVYIVGFLMLGFVSSGVFINVAIYNSEISEDKNRAWIGCVVGLMMPTGNLLGYIFGALLDNVRNYTLFCALPAVLHILLSFFVVESPPYLVCKKKKSEALTALEKLRKTKNFKDIEMEYRLMEEFNVSGDPKKQDTFAIFRCASARKALFLGFVLCTTQQLSGILIVMSYIVIIFNEAHASLSGTTVSILFGIVHISIILVAAFIVNRFGRKPLILFSSLGCSISMIFLTIYFYMNDHNMPIVNSIRWIPIACIMFFIVSYGMGLGPIPMVLIGELFRNDLRAVGVATITIAECLITIISQFLYPLLTVSYGVYLSTAVYAVSTLIGFVLLLVLLPETRGKSFMEIQKILSK